MLKHAEREPTSKTIPRTAFGGLATKLKRKRAFWVNKYKINEYLRRLSQVTRLSQATWFGDGGRIPRGAWHAE